jgi:hypothetical protein
MMANEELDQFIITLEKKSRQTENLAKALPFLETLVNSQIE